MGLNRTLYIGACWEKFETTLFKKLVKKGMVVVDIGANVVYYALLAVNLVGEKGRVFAFEPNPRSYALLMKNIDANGLHNVVAYPMAVSDRIRVAKLFTRRNHLGGGGLWYSPEGRKSINVNTTTLDGCLGKMNCPINIVKMDIDGSETASLRGMRNIMKKNDLTILVT